MLSNHICDNTCLNKRHANITNCLKCNNKFNLKCFNFNLAASNYKVSPNSNIVFVCTSCHNSIMKTCKNATTNVRRSINCASSSTNVSAIRNATTNQRKSMNTPTIDTASTSNSTTMNSSQLNDDIMTLKNESEKHSVILNEILTHIMKSADVSEQQQNKDKNNDVSLNSFGVYSQINDNIVPLKNDFHELRNVLINIPNHSENITALQNIEQLSNNIVNNLSRSCIDYNKIEDIFKLHGCKNKVFTKNACKNLSNSNPLDWSFSTNNHVNTSVHNDTRPDLYQLWHSFESNSWAAIDEVIQLIKLLSGRLDNIYDSVSSDISDLSRRINTSVTKSALVGTINNEERRSDNSKSLFLNLESKLVAIIDLVRCDGGESSHSSSTQLFRDRLNMLRSTPDDNNSTSISNDLTDSQVIPELLNTTNAEREVLHLMGNIDLVRNDNMDGEVAIKCNDSPNGDSQVHTLNDQLNGKKVCNDNLICELYVTKFSPNTSSENILDYMIHGGVNRTNIMRVTPLIPRGRDLTTLSFLSFKIDVHREAVDQ